MNPIQKNFIRMNAWLIRVTGGRLGSQMGPQTVLLLHTVGRKTGKPRVTPLSHYRDGDNYLIVGSNWGSETPPDWLNNLLAHPAARIEVLGKPINITASVAAGAERERLWKLVTAKNSQFLQYQNNIQRQIPIVILRPT